VSLCMWAQTVCGLPALAGCFHLQTACTCNLQLRVPIPPNCVRNCEVQLHTNWALNCSLKTVSSALASGRSVPKRAAPTLPLGTRVSLFWTSA